MERFHEVINRAKKDARSGKFKSFQNFVKFIIFSELRLEDWNRKRFAESFPNLYVAENIARVSNPSVEDFEREYKMPGIPAILTNSINHWPAMKEWTIDVRNIYIEVVGNINKGYFIETYRTISKSIYEGWGR